MTKWLFSVMLVVLLVGCAAKESICPPCEPVQVTKEVEVTRPVEVIKKVEVTKLVESIKKVEVTRLVEITTEGPKELGPWTIQQTITQTGQYLVPDEMQPGQWAYKADDPKDTCWAKTYSDLSGSSDSILDNFYSENKGFFVLNENAKISDHAHGPG
jgi:hypothetical protein